jgi:hypothetical protein
MLMSSLFLLAAMTTATASPVAAPVAWIDRPVEEVYVQKGDVLDFLPELLAQLDAPAAGIDLGRILSMQVLVKDTSPGGPHPNIVTKRPERQVGPLEMKNGTVRQVLNELVHQRPELAWRDDNGVLLITSTAGKNSVTQPVLDYRLAKYKVDKKPWIRALGDIEDPVHAAIPAAAETINWYDPMLRNPPVIPPRRPLDVPVTLDKVDASARQLLTDLVRQVPGGFWMAYDEADDPFGIRRSPGGYIVIGRISEARRGLSLEILVRCLDNTYAPLHGYINQRVRMDDARKELSRRFRFHPVEVVQALLKPEGLPQMIRDQKTINAQDLVEWACGLGDESLKTAMMELIPTLKDADRRYRCFAGFSLDPRMKLDLKRYLPFWNRMLDDPDIRVREEAQRLIGWAKEEPEAKP